MEIDCPIDVEYADEIAALLAPPSPQSMQEYFDQLMRTRKCRSLKVEHRGEHGKGVYANKVFEEGELVLKDQILFGAQHSSNKMDCLVCGHCFRFIGSIELQIGRKLYFQSLGLSATEEDSPHNETFSHAYGESCSSERSDEEDKDPGACSDSYMKDKITLPNDVIESLMDGRLVLPFSEKFTLPSAISCPGGCEEEHYCSKPCAEAAWETSHSLLCMGKNWGLSRRKALLKFIEHANGTNDIFLLAGKVISSTVLKYKKLKMSHVQDHKQVNKSNGVDQSSFSLLLNAWKPISMAFKRRWWECISLPNDVDSENETSFRRQIRELAFKSLQLLKEAIFHKDCAPLFSLEIYGHVIGMFELNNLDLVVASPVEDYFILIDDLPHPEKEEVDKITRPFLDALGDDYSICCQVSW
ncbi:histone-lysine N-methyltransferase ATXR2 isoform X2 [Aristolochia californica]|uniref:histone-lysine N-methyltransferase ATXR2 isoform X2 n=1 Tax=Aristolochia californica TaxID=171875 RepID=UPI0035E030AC